MQDSDNLVWVFGYGSLIFRADFPFLKRQPACIQGWERRFWQGSHDHRGVPDAPGRVVTLVPVPNSVCGGMAYLVEPDVFEYLDHREKNGYSRVQISLEFKRGELADGVAYIGGQDNFAYLGPAPLPEIADQIRQSSGPSGANVDYLLNLVSALRELEIDDEHVFALEALL